MSHSDQVIDQMNAEPQPFQVFASQLGEELTRENIFAAREKGLLVCWRSKAYIHISGAINAIFNMGKVLSEVQVFLSTEEGVKFQAGGYSETYTEKYPPTTWQHIAITETNNTIKFATAIPHATFASGIVLQWK